MVVMLAANKFFVCAYHTSVALILAGCGQVCTRQAVWECSGKGEACDQATFLGDECCRWMNKLMLCHKEHNCDCSTLRNEPDGLDDVKKFMDDLRSKMQLCLQVNVTPNDYCK
mmetsp:Transcript_75893/g.150091  ORF Transcript_75893/g.150091 Transcript_75893/m.150091 type:complete len:113 (-) Transcript_75893:161-499(-)